jgi:hypothetical protein
MSTADCCAVKRAELFPFVIGQNCPLIDVCARWETRLLFSHGVMGDEFWSSTIGQRRRGLQTRHALDNAG